MEREAMLCVLSCACFGPMVWACAALAARGVHRSEKSLSRAWFRLVAPVFAGVLPVAFLIGWALQEPDPACEWLTRLTWALAGFVPLISVRALGRAWVAARPMVNAPTVATVGLFRQQIVVSPAFAAEAGPEVLAAALAHESAHLAGRDPLRIWLAQILADLQWPVPGTRQRLDTWLLAIEMRRDDDALAAGASRAGLAEAILLAARLADATAIPRGAHADGGGSCLGQRIHRLLDTPGDPVRGDPVRGERSDLGSTLGTRDLSRERSHKRWLRWSAWPGRSAWVLYGSSLVALLWVGFASGESVLAVLPGIGR